MLYPLSMSVQIRFSAVLLSLSLVVPAGAAAISGSVFDDTRALANRADFAPLAGVTVRAFRDGGDGLPNGADDKPAGEAVTVANGLYEINVAGNGLYWIAVDSRSINAASSITGNRPWAKPLPALADDGTAINGTAYRFTNGTPVVLSRQEIDVNDEAGTRRPEIDLVIELAGEDGLVFERRGAIRSVGLTGAKTAIRAKSDLTIERSMIGGSPATTVDGIVITHGMLAINNSIITGLARYAITVDGDATLDAG